MSSENDSTLLTRHAKVILFQSDVVLRRCHVIVMPLACHIIMRKLYIVMSHFCHIIMPTYKGKVAALHRRVLI